VCLPKRPINRTSRRGKYEHECPKAIEHLQASYPNLECRIDLGSGGLRAFRAGVYRK
jgi:hypothetical protein